ncbi:hypothetical protein [Fundidesulfovibrio soli]|uniref:hypothetical protein n=1 Tax=Fundidesulfovibrio soli TaxID=2922716 RepID=UPI001FAFCFE0|nr:hypothetical protein [Fundidesulfovibrio soli]
MTRHAFHRILTAAAVVASVALWAAITAAPAHADRYYYRGYGPRYAPPPPPPPRGYYYAPPPRAYYYAPPPAYYYAPPPAYYYAPPPPPVPVPGFSITIPLR